MKTAILSRLWIIMVIAGVGLIYACNKSSVSNSGSGSGNTTADLQTQADDQAQVSNESDALTNDANSALNGQSSVSGASTGEGQGSSAISTMGVIQVDSTGTGNSRIISGNLICDASVVWSDSAGQRTITITYNGSNCWGNRTRKGIVVITIPEGVYWRNAGATITISIQNLTITRLRDNKVIVINGTKMLTNTSGGLLADLPNLDSIRHNLSGSLTINFPNGSQRIWNVSKQRVFTYNNGIVITTTGTHTDSQNNMNVAEWGVNRFGVSFESLITQPKVISQSCEYRLVSGQNKVLRSDNITSLIAYGLDADGNPTSCPGTGTYYFKLVVMKANGTTFTYILPY